MDAEQLKFTQVLATVTAGIGASVLLNKAISKYTTRGHQPLQLSVPDMDAIYMDHEMVQALKVMEAWSKLNPIFYEQIIIYLDNMMTIERDIMSKETFPSLKSLDIAYQNFRLAAKYLTDYRETILKYCGTDDASAFDPFLKIVYSRSQNHFLNIINKCRRFDTKQYMASTQKRIDAIIASH